jgi:FdhD protein
MADPASSLSEASVWIGINGKHYRVLSCSAHHLDALAIGHLAAEGCIRTMQDVKDVEIFDGPGGACGANIIIDDALAEAATRLRQHRLEHGCGLRHELDCEPGSLRGRKRTPVSADVDLSIAFRGLFAYAEQESPLGGLHACALMRGNGIVFMDTDVARHCAVDRLIGAAVMAEADPGALGLLLSARLSGAMALKAAIAGIGWIASRSVATSLATEIVTAADLPILQRAVRRAKGP